MIVLTLAVMISLKCLIKYHKCESISLLAVWKKHFSLFCLLIQSGCDSKLDLSLQSEQHLPTTPDVIYSKICKSQ